MFLNHLSRPSVAGFGLKIRGEAVVKGEHTLYLIVEAGDERQLQKFLAPFESAGSVEVHPASTCSGVVEAGGCGATMPISELMSALDPEVACQDAIESGLVVHRAHPLNCETSIPALMGGVVIPNARFYVRNHFYIPNLDPENYRLQVGGLVEQPLSLNLHELRAMRSHSQAITLECAGNGRSLFDPPIEGEKWDLGAVSTAEWTGVPLAALLEQADVRADAGEVLFRGADGGMVDGHSEPIRFERSLRLDDTQLAGALLAYAMNGEPLPYSGLGLSELRELRQLREENSKLKHLVADLSLDRQPTLVPNFQIFAKFDARSKRRDRFSRDSPVVRRQNLLDKLATELREDLVHLG
jgi:DMSO/TMAO reductase YedYZ molybdopterin-dependent catalytic subunit